jgi:hypothetical protein
VPPRVAYVGQSTFFQACVPSREHETFVEFRENVEPVPMRDALDRFAPDVVVVFRPETFPPGILSDLDAAIIGFLTEPVPRSLDGTPHPDLAKRARDLRRLDPMNVDRIVSFDPNIVPVADQVMPVWRSLPIPVADRLYRDPRPLTSPPRLVFIGRSTPHRETYLRPVKEHYDLLHVAFGAGVDDLERYLLEHEVTLNLHNEPYPSFENRVCLHLAAGHLVISEPLSPRHGLEPGRDYLEVASPDELMAQLRAVETDPRRAQRIRICGRTKAEAFRASAVFDRLVGDLLADLDAFGSPRRERLVA